MNVKTLHRLNPLITAISSPTDSIDDVIKKLVILGGNLGGFFYTIILTVIYTVHHLILPAALSCIYLVAVALAYVYYFRTKQLGITTFLFSFLLFLQVVGIHITLGGFVASGLIFIWGTACVLMPLTANQTRLAALWISLFLISTSILTWIEPVIVASGPSVPEKLSNILFFMNFGFGLTYMLAATFYFVSALEIARQRADVLLMNILPNPIATRLKTEPGTIADSFGEVTILFADIVDFTKLCSGANPVDVVNLLNKIFCDFDDLAEKYQLEKIKTIGDAYMVAGGLIEPRIDHCEATALFAFDMIEAASKHTAWNDEPIRLRVGMNTGPVVAGVIGRHKFIYDLWGDAVNTASRMESNGLADAIQVTETVKENLRGKYEFEEREPIYIKGKGEMVTYLMRLP